MKEKCTGKNEKNKFGKEGDSNFLKCSATFFLDDFARGWEMFAISTSMFSSLSLIGVLLTQHAQLVGGFPKTNDCNGFIKSASKPDQELDDVLLVLIHLEQSIILHEKVKKLAPIEMDMDMDYNTETVLHAKRLTSVVCDVMLYTVKDPGSQLWGAQKDLSD